MYLQKKLLKISVLITIFIVGMNTALSAQNLSFSDFNEDGGDYLSMQEFIETFEFYYIDDWDNTDNVGLDDEDFYIFTYGLIDTDDDDLIDSAEWMVGYDYYYGDYVDEDYIVYDLNGDGYISYTEYENAVIDTDYYVVLDVDRDTYLSEEELSEAVFNTWDTNDDMLLSREEFIDFDLYYEDV